MYTSKQNRKNQNSPPYLMKGWLLKNEYNCLETNKTLEQMPLSEANRPISKMVRFPFYRQKPYKPDFHEIPDIKLSLLLFQ